MLHRLDHNGCERLVHLDLLHHARRRWKGRLQTLERFVCGRLRAGDIPGHEIPAAYHHFVRTHDAWQIRSILHHNALNLMTLLELSLRMANWPRSHFATVPTPRPFPILWVPIDSILIFDKGLRAAM